MKNLFLICALMFILASLSAQNKIYGVVKDQNNTPLNGAVIYIPDLNKSSISDANGEYQMLNLPNGKFNIQCSYIGYANYIQTITLQGKSEIHNIQMFQTAIAVEEIVVSAGYNTTQHETAVKIEVLKINPVTNKNTSNFTEILTQIPGVDMISKGNGVAKPVIRGLSMNDILILNNGVRFENYQYSSHHPLGIDEFGIEDVEVIKGPASLIYGSDAIGGVLNFIKEKPASVGTIVGDYNVQLFSNSLGITQNLGIKGASKHFFGGVRMGHKNNADYLQGGGTFVPNTRFNEYSFKSNVGFTGKIGVFKLFYDFNNQNLGLAEEDAIESITERGWQTQIWYQRLNTHLLSSQNKLFFGKVVLDLNAAMQQTQLMHAEESDEIEIEMQLRTLTYEAKFKLPTYHKSDFIFGLQGYNQWNKNINQREVQLLPNATIDNFSLFTLYQLGVSKNFKMEAGLRFDLKKITSESIGNLLDTMEYRQPINKLYRSFSGSIGTTYHLNKQILFRANLASAYRTPNLAELTSKGQHELRFEVGDPDLKPEKSYEADINMHYHIENLSIDIAGFYNYIYDYIFIAPTGLNTFDGVGIYKYKQSNSMLYGGETGIHYHPKNHKWLCLEGSYAMVIGKQMNGDYLPFIPAHKFKFEVRVEKDNIGKIDHPYLSIQNFSSLAQNRPALDEEATKAYSLFDFNIGGAFKVNQQLFQIVFSVNNIFDVKYIDHLSTLKEVQMFNPGRNFVLTLKLPFKMK